MNTGFYSLCHLGFWNENPKEIHSNLLWQRQGTLGSRTSSLQLRFAQMSISASRNPLRLLTICLYAICRSSTVSFSELAKRKRDFMSFFLSLFSFVIRFLFESIQQIVPRSRGSFSEGNGVSKDTTGSIPLRKSLLERNLVGRDRSSLRDRFRLRPVIDALLNDVSNEISMTKIKTKEKRRSGLEFHFLSCHFEVTDWKGHAIWQINFSSLPEWKIKELIRLLAIPKEALEEIQNEHRVL